MGQEARFEEEKSESVGLRPIQGYGAEEEKEPNHREENEGARLSNKTVMSNPLCSSYLVTLLVVISTVY